MRRTLFAIILAVVGVFFVAVPPVSAQVCSGLVECCQARNYNCGPNQDPPNCPLTCEGAYWLSCFNVGNDCGLPWESCNWSGAGSCWWDFGGPTPTPTPACVPSCSPACGQADGCGGTCSSSDTNNWTATGSWCDGNCGTATCYTSYSNPCGGSSTQATGSTCNECGPHYGAWSSCSGSPASKTRTVTYDCAGAGSETISCYGTLSARATVISPSGSCSDAQTSGTGLAGTGFTFSAGSASQPSGTQSNNSYVSFPNIVGGSYWLTPNPPLDYVLRAACWTKTLNTPLTGTDPAVWLSVPIDGDTVTWDLGYSLGASWFQVSGGDVIAGTTVDSLVPDSTLPRVFLTDSTDNDAGVVLHGSDTPLPGYDFAADPLDDGEDRISATGMIATDDGPFQLWDDPWDPYTVFWRRFGGPITIDYDGTAWSLSQPASRTEPYTVTGTLGTAGDWVIPTGEQLTFLVDGDVEINGSITTQGTGMVAIITNGDITVANTVGVPVSSSTPVLEGIYISGGTFHTGTSATAGKERLVAKGAFFANQFSMERDLGDDNTTTAPELFLFDPRTILFQPERMKNLDIVWMEVAP